MAYTDRLLTFNYNRSLATSISALTTGTYVHGDVIDLRTVTNRVGVGKTLWVVVEVVTQVITGGSAGTLQAFVVTDAAADLASAVVANCTLIAQSVAMVTDDTTALAVGIEAGTATYLPNIAPTTAVTGIADFDKVHNRPPMICVQIPTTNQERYLGILLTIGTTTITAGSVNAYITTDPPQNWRGLPDGI